jgi:drug/metabolite transporter (DMT)-like permease
MAETTPDSQTWPESRHHRDREGGSWIAGVVLILLGLAFLAERGGYIALTGNWWALLIYIAAVASFANVWRSYRARGSWGAQATGSLVWGLVFAVVASIFIFNLAWDVWWPVILVAVGAGILAGALLGSMTNKPVA